MKKFLLLGIGILLGHFAYSEKMIYSIVVSPTNVCQGDTITMVFTYDNTYSGGSDKAFYFLSDLGGTSYSTSNIIDSFFLSGTTTTVKYRIPVSQTTGAYRIWGKDTLNSNRQVDTFSNQFTVVAPPTVSAGSPQSVCQAGTVTLAGSVTGSSTTGIWSAPSGSFSTATVLNTQYTPSITTGTVTLTLTSTGAACVRTSTVVITVYPTPTANAGSNQSVCQGGSVTLAGSIGGSATGSTWSAPSGSFSNASSLSSSYTPSITSGTVTLTLTTSGPACTPATSTVVITVNATPTANAGSPQTICQGTAATLAGSIGGSATGSIWSAPSGSFSNAASLTSNYTPSITSGTVTLTLTTTGPCTPATSTVVITVNSAATSNAGSAGTTCSGSAYTLTGATIGGSATTGTWSITAVTGSLTNASSQLSNTSATGTPAAVTFTPISGNFGTATLTLTTDDPSGPCPAATSNVVITVNQAATSNAGSNATTCRGSNYTLTGASVGGSASTGAWSITAVTGSMSNNSSQLSSTSQTANPASVVFNPIGTNTGTVTLTLTTNDPSGPCGAVSSSMVLTYNPDATANAGTNTTICSGAPYTLSGATIGGAASTGAWSIKSVTGTMSNSASQLSSTSQSANPAAVIFTPIATNSGTITLTLTTDDPSGPCTSASNDVVLTVNPAPTANAGSANTICSGEPYILAGSSIGGGAINGTWSITGVTGTMTNVASQLSNSGATSTPASVIFTPVTGNSGTVILTLTANATAPCTSTTSTVTLIVRPLSTANAGSPKSVCQGGSVSITGIVGGSATGGIWSAPSGGFSNANSLTTNYTPSITNGNVTLTLTSTGPCNAITSTVVITVNPTATADAGPAMTAICQTGTSAALGGSVGGSATGGTWSDNGIGGTFNPNATTLNATYTPPTSFSGMVTLTLTSSGGSCGTPTSSKALQVNPNATVSLASGITNQVICLGFPISDIKYTIGGGGTGTNVTGLPAGVVGSLAGTIFTISGTPTVSGTFNYTVTTTGICAPATKTGTITVNPKPTRPEFLTSNPTSVCFNQKGVNFGVKAQPDIVFLWSSTNNLIEFHGKHKANCLIDFPTAGSPFTIYAIATNSITGCKDTSVLTLTVSSTIPSTPRILLTNANKTLVCLDNTQATYQWGYDDTTFISTDISGAILQDYTPAGGINPNRNYYVRLNSGGCTYKVYYNAPLGVSASLNELSIAIQPNPNKGQFNLKLSGNKIPEIATITDVLGQSIMNIALHQGDNYIQMPAVANGIYYIQLIDNSGNSQTLKFIINQ